ncbi:MAG: hypothetical protein ACP5RH_03845 [Leptodesmis sp.]|uniref:hypothetical protein n=2 Tax=Leptodesmis TaxID=2664261 RepID=UPI003D0D8025|nr:hypothetical protein KIK02_05475 [Leptodesmis sichuanensis A121]
MNQDSLKTMQMGMASLSRLLFPLFLIWVLGAIGLGWLVKSLLILFGLILLAPILAFLGFRWWLKRNLVQSQCPVCNLEFVGLNQTEFQCPSCGEPLKVEHGHFNRMVPPGTIDVSAVEVPARQIED